MILINSVLLLLQCQFCNQAKAWWLQLHRLLALIGLLGAIAGAALGGGLQAYDYHPVGAGTAHKALGIVAVVTVSIQVGAHSQIQTVTTVGFARILAPLMRSYVGEKAGVLTSVKRSYVGKTCRMLLCKRHCM